MSTLLITKISYLFLHICNNLGELLKGVPGTWLLQAGLRILATPALDEVEYAIVRSAKELSEYTAGLRREMFQATLRGDTEKADIIQALISHQKQVLVSSGLDDIINPDTGVINEEALSRYKGDAKT